MNRRSASPPMDHRGHGDPFPGHAAHLLLQRPLLGEPVRQHQHVLDRGLLGRERPAALHHGLEEVGAAVGAQARDLLGDARAVPRGPEGNRPLPVRVEGQDAHFVGGVEELGRRHGGRLGQVQLGGPEGAAPHAAGLVHHEEQRHVRHLHTHRRAHFHRQGPFQRRPVVAAGAVAPGPAQHDESAPEVAHEPFHPLHLHLREPVGGHVVQDQQVEARQLGQGQVGPIRGLLHHLVSLDLQRFGHETPGRVRGVEVEDPGRPLDAHDALQQVVLRQHVRVRVHHQLVGVGAPLLHAVGETQAVGAGGQLRAQGADHAPVPQQGDARGRFPALSRAASISKVSPLSTTEGTANSDR